MEGGRASALTLGFGSAEGMLLTRWRPFCEMGEDGMTGKDGLLTPGKIKIPTQLLLYQENVSVPRFFFPSLCFSFDIARCFGFR